VLSEHNFRIWLLPSLPTKNHKTLFIEAGPVFAHGTTEAKPTVGSPPPPPHKNLQQQQKNAKLCNIVTATSLLN
jgi:hypothetical protein